MANEAPSAGELVMHEIPSPWSLGPVAFPWLEPARIGPRLDQDRGPRADGLAARRVWSTLRLVAHHLAIRPGNLARPSCATNSPPDCLLDACYSDSPRWAFRCATASRFTAGVTIFLTEVPSSPPCRASARPAASSAWHSPSQLPSNQWRAMARSSAFSRVAIVARTNGATMATLRHRHPGILRLPSIECSLRHPVLAAESSTLRARLMLLQEANDLLFRQSYLLHRPSSPSAGLQSQMEEKSRGRARLTAPPA